MRLQRKKEFVWGRSWRLRCGQFVVVEFQHCWIVRQSNSLADRPWCPTVTGLTARDQNWNVSVVFTSVETEYLYPRIPCHVHIASINTNTDATPSIFKRIEHFWATKWQYIINLLFTVAHNGWNSFN